MSITISLIIICLLIIAIVTGIEYAYLSSNKLTIELRRKQGKSNSIEAASFFDAPERFWSGTIITTYIILVITCFLISKTTIWIAYNILPAKYYHYFNTSPYIGMLVDFLVAGFLIVTTIGFFAKKIFDYNPEAKLTTWSRFIGILADITNPLASLFVNLAHFILKYLFNVRIKEPNKAFERPNIKQFVYQSIEGHIDFENANKNMFDKAIRLSNLKLRNCLTPRNEAVAININAPIQILKDKFIATKLSKIIVFENTLDNIVGYVHHIDINKKPASIHEILIAIPVVPETMTAIDLMNRFSKERKSIAWVVDEFGGTAGFTTMEAILEEVFGNLRDEYDISEFTERVLHEGEYILSGRLDINYLNNQYDLEITDEESKTLSGYIINNHGSIPNLRQRIVIDNFEFEILLVTATRIETVRLKKLNFQ